MHIENSSDLRSDITNKYTSVGGYPKFWYTNDNRFLSYEYIRDNLEMLCDEIDNNYPSHIVGSYVNWDDPSMYCDGSSERIESAYAEDEVI